VTRDGWPSLRDMAASVAGGGDPAEWARRAADRIAAADGGEDGLRAFLSHDPDRLVRDAEALAGVGGSRPLAGVPVAVKDNLCTTGHPTTCGSRILEGFRSPFDAEVVRRLRAAGAVVAGKTNMDEFGMGSSTENSAFGPTRNPWDRGRVPGGSSGGSAAAVASGMVPAALGSDTGGSVRQPAAFCGVVGVKPTYGAVSRYGLVAYASSLDQVGVMARTVADAATLLQVVAGPDPRDSTSAAQPPGDLTATLGLGVDGLVIGVPAEYFPPDLDAGIRRTVDLALAALVRAGATVRTLSLPHTALAIPCYYVLAPAEASSNLARYDGVRFGTRVEAATADELYGRSRSAGFGREVKRRILLGTFALSAGYQDRFYGKAQQVRGLISSDFLVAFDAGVDVVFTPTTPGTAFRLGERTRDPYAMYRADVFTVTANLAGLPAASVPIGFVNGLPVGGQLIARHWGEPTLLRAAAALEAGMAGAERA
jgi:aspartyl-tRNA(Asn)/glutamyl-tRNA(Gln) amidotransferase subunit A